MTTIIATISNQMREAAHLCHECHDMCTELIPHCLNLGGEHAHAEHILLLLDSAEVCQTCENVMHRGSPRHALVCDVCAEVCEQCAESCKHIAGHDRQMRDCIEMCHTCARSCHAMATEYSEHEHAAQHLRTA